MHTFRLLSWAALLSLPLLSCTSAASTRVPDAVKQAFETKFPEATSVRWEQENPQEWEAEFKQHGEAYSANFSPEGQWLETEMELDPEALPDAIRRTLATQFGEYEVEEAEAVEQADGTRIFETELEHGETTLEVTFRPDGTVVSQLQEEDDQDQD
ncbi:Putative beta-lactamase-inhibitor-like, PepSY-like [Catalinimonas alkaloidigena]|uniref:Putative beta-lactamase-inhibitor-like, PepSY-like n=1 Tax=Catalinimonas alkaloidigena TaxID=1075417 RepID=A0A1G9TL31_9BACT|nr:PepSY-like domain-containing protein [Catalinimonas alkaloidigena]SDM48342.1 Putative beta-lactamase-inhibitor-like, PepSY-like [Catalinimonas alkaloidigena]